MKLIRCLILLSLVTNGALLLLLGAGVLQWNDSAAGAVPMGPNVPTKGVSPTESKSDATRGAWEKLRAESPAAQRDRLRVEQFPPSVIRGIFAWQLRSPRRKELEGLLAATPYWRVKDLGSKLQTELNDLARREEQRLTELLGRDPDKSAAASIRRQFPGFTEATVEKVGEVVDRFQEERREMFSSGLSDPSDQLRGLEKKQRAALAAVLSATEFEDYDLRVGSVAENLRTQLTAFSPTEAEFRLFHRLQAAHEEQFPPMHGAVSPEKMREHSVAQRELQGRIKAALGPERAAEYERSIDPNFRQTAQLIARLELPPETAQQVHALQRELQTRAVQVQVNRTLTQDERTQQLAALSSEARSKIGAVLGPDGYEAYQQFGGSWLAMLQPRVVVP